MANGNITQTGLTNDPPTGLEEIVVPEPPTEGYRNPYTKQIMAGRTVPTREEIKIINTWNETRDPRYKNAAMELSKKYGIKYGKRKGVNLPDLKTYDYAGLSKKFGVPLPELMNELNNNPMYSEEQFNTRLYGNAATMTDVFNTKIPDLKKDVNRRYGSEYNAYQVNINKQRYAEVIDKNNPNMRNALDISDKIISEYQTDPDNFFNKQIETNVNTSYNLPPQSANSKTRTGYDNILGIFKLVKPGGEYNKARFKDLTIVDKYDQDQKYGGLSTYEQEDIKGISTASSGVTTFGEDEKGIRSFLQSRGKTAEKAADLAPAQVANADYNNFMNEVFGGKTLLDSTVMLPNINLTKEYIAQQTENMSFNEKRRFRRDFLNLTIKGFEAGFKGGSIPKRAQGARVGVDRIAKVLFGESLGGLAFNDLYK